MSEDVDRHQDAPAHVSPDIDEVLAREPDRASREVDAARPTALGADEANRLGARARLHVVVLAGSVGSGKTSVYASMYERLGRGPFGGWEFAGSSTIPGFERRCHFWRTASGADEPSMEHTRAQDLPWLHLRVVDVERRGAPRDLLLGDFDGEYFEQFRDGRRSPEELPFLRRADHVGLIIDGKRLADPTQRADERQQARYLLRRLLETGTLASPNAMMLILTKADELEGNPALEEIEALLLELNAEANRIAQGQVPLIRLAVRSRTARYPLGQGLETLLEYLDKRGTLQIGHPPEVRSARTALGRFLG